MAFSKNRRLADLVSSAGEVSSFVDASVTHADLHTSMDLTGKTVTVANASTGDSDTTAANTAFVQQEIAALVDSAPGTLNTLNELAAALGDDASFSTTVTNSIATKLPLAGGTMTGNIAHASDFTIDVGGDIILDADGGDIRFKDGGTEIGVFENSSSDLLIKASVTDKDIIFRGSGVNALTLDMSDAGTAIFNNKVVVDTLELAPDGGNDLIKSTGSVLYVKANEYSFQNNSGAERVTINSSGNVGIGDSPDTQLHVKNTGGIELRLEADSNNNGQEDCFVRFYTDGKTQEGIAGMDNNNSSTLFSGNTENGMVFGTVSNLPTLFATNNTQRMIILNDGRVGINRTPAISNSKLEVGGADNVPLINVEASGNTGGMGIGSTGLQFFHGTTKQMIIDSNYVVPKMNFHYSNSNTGDTGSTTANEINSGAGVLMLKQQITVRAGSKIIVWCDSGQITQASAGAYNPQMAIYIDSHASTPSRGPNHRINQDGDHRWYPGDTNNSRIFLTAMGAKNISTAGTYYIYVYGGSYNTGTFTFNAQGATRGCSIVWAEVMQ